MAYKPLSLLFILALAGCGAHHRHHKLNHHKLHHHKQCPSSAEPEAGTVTLTGHCAGAVLLVVPERGTFQYGVDPVETYQGILRSRTFRASLHKSHPSASKTEYAIRRIDRSALLKVIVSHSTEIDAAKACEALVQLALANDDPSTLGSDDARSWLMAQRKTLTKKLDRAEEQLRAFKKEHGLVALSLSDRRSLAREQLKNLHGAKNKTTSPKRRKEIAKAIDSLTEDMLRDNMLEIEEKRLAREVSGAEQMLQAVVSRMSEGAVERMLDRRLRTLDSCAPVECR